MKKSFADILKQFEESQFEITNKKNKKNIHDTMLGYIDKYGVVDKDKDIERLQEENKISYKVNCKKYCPFFFEKKGFI